VLAALVVLALGAQATVWLGMGLDWLLPVVAASILALGVPPRAALASTAAIFLGTFATVALAGMGATTSPGAFFQIGLTDALELLPVYVFVVIFSLVLRRQQVLRERAEALAAELARSKRDLEQANAQLRRFAGQVEELAVTQERNRVAREIHDTLGHYLTILAVKLETATQLEALAAPGDPRLRAELAEARRMASECLSEVRHSVAALRPADQTATTLEASLRRLCAETESAAPEMTVTLDVEGAAGEMPPDARVALYRAAQEALTNARKHARASKVLVRLRVEADAAELTVLDNGVGRAAHAADTSGFGLIGMRERVALLGGTVAAGPEERGGWRVEARVPLRGAAGGLPGGTNGTADGAMGAMGAEAGTGADAAARAVEV
jgi:signal transduction histidine kinase